MRQTVQFANPVAVVNHACCSSGTVMCPACARRALETQAVLTSVPMLNSELRDLIADRNPPVTEANGPPIDFGITNINPRRIEVVNGGGPELPMNLSWYDGPKR